jgi:hypothetical protein
LAGSFSLYAKSGQLKRLNESTEIWFMRRRLGRNMVKTCEGLIIDVKNNQISCLAQVKQVLVGSDIDDILAKCERAGVSLKTLMVAMDVVIPEDDTDQCLKAMATIIGSGTADIIAFKLITDRNPGHSHYIAADASTGNVLVPPTRVLSRCHSDEVMLSIEAKKMYKELAATAKKAGGGDVSKYDGFRQCLPELLGVNATDASVALAEVTKAVLKVFPRELDFIVTNERCAGSKVAESINLMDLRHQMALKLAAVIAHPLHTGHIVGIAGGFGACLTEFGFPRMRLDEHEFVDALLVGDAGARASKAGCDHATASAREREHSAVVAKLQEEGSRMRHKLDEALKQAIVIAPGEDGQQPDQPTGQSVASDAAGRTGDAVAATQAVEVETQQYGDGGGGVGHEATEAVAATSDDRSDVVDAIDDIIATVVRPIKKEKGVKAVDPQPMRSTAALQLHIANVAVELLYSRYLDSIKQLVQFDEESGSLVARVEIEPRGLTLPFRGKAVQSTQSKFAVPITLAGDEEESSTCVIDGTMAAKSEFAAWML